MVWSAVFDGVLMQVSGVCSDQMKSLLSFGVIILSGTVASLWVKRQSFNNMTLLFHSTFLQNWTHSEKENKPFKWAPGWSKSITVPETKTGNKTCTSLYVYHCTHTQQHFMTLEHLLVACVSNPTSGPVSGHGECLCVYLYKSTQRWDCYFVPTQPFWCHICESRKYHQCYKKPCVCRKVFFLTSTIGNCVLNVKKKCGFYRQWWAVFPSRDGQCRTQSWGHRNVTNMVFKGILWFVKMWTIAGFGLTPNSLWCASITQ